MGYLANMIRPGRARHALTSGSAGTASALTGLAVEAADFDAYTNSRYPHEGSVRACLTGQLPGVGARVCIFRVPRSRTSPLARTGTGSQASGCVSDTSPEGSTVKCRLTPGVRLCSATLQARQRGSTYPSGHSMRMYPAHGSALWFPARCELLPALSTVHSGATLVDRGGAASGTAPPRRIRAGSTSGSAA